MGSTCASCCGRCMLRMNCAYDVPAAGRPHPGGPAGTAVLPHLISQGRVTCASCWRGCTLHMQGLACLCHGHAALWHLAEATLPCEQALPQHQPCQDQVSGETVLHVSHSFCCLQPWAEQLGCRANAAPAHTVSQPGACQACTRTSHAQVELERWGQQGPKGDDHGHGGQVEGPVLLDRIIRQGRQEGHHRWVRVLLYLLLLWALPALHSHSTLSVLVCVTVWVGSSPTPSCLGRCPSCMAPACRGCTRSQHRACGRRFPNLCVVVVGCAL